MTTKIHLSTDGKGRIEQKVLTAGQTADIKMSIDLIQGTKSKKVIADKMYDADWLLHYLDSEGFEAIVLLKEAACKKK